MAKKPTRRPTPSARGVDKLRARVQQERDAAIARLQQLRLSPDLADGASPGGNETALEEGDAAQISESRDVSFTTRERLARRVNQLTAALERIERGTYGRCIECDLDIEPARLTAIPEAATCLQCQADRERREAPNRVA
jgi:DnaK suppressor protein